MNQKNFEYLRDQVKYTGFGEGLENDLREKLSKQTPDFTLKHNAQYSNDMAASIAYRQGADRTERNGSCSRVIT